jgi:acyl-CoA synthetase (NDP forming)
MQECIQAFPSLRCVNVVSGGFRETSSGGNLELQLLKEAQQHNIRLIGPNSVGVIDAYSDYSSMFLRIFPIQGGLSLISQSGGVCGAAIELACHNPSLGFSKVLALGNAADVGFVDALQAVRDDNNTSVVMLHLEGLGPDQGDEFIETAREVALEKPILALKGGTTAAGSRAVSSHTGALAGNERIYEAAFRAAGIVQAPSLRSMLDMAQALSCHSRVQYTQGIDLSALNRGSKYRIAVVTNAGGPGALTVDKLASNGAASVPALPDLIQERIREADGIHKLAATANPVDLLGGATPLSYQSALHATLDCREVDAVVCLHVPTALSHPKDLADTLISASKQTLKPLVAMMVSSDHRFVDSAVTMLHEASIPTFCHPDEVGDAIRAWKDREDRYPTRQSETESAYILSQETVNQCRTYLSQLGGSRWILEHEARVMLDLVDIDQPRGMLISSGLEKDIILAANTIGYPVVLKRVDDVHKSDKGGVGLNLQDESQVRASLRTMLPESSMASPPPILVCKQVKLQSTREFLVGFTRDESFGPVVCFGTGGTMVEAIDDVAFALPPRSRRDTHDLLQQAKLAARRITGGIRSEPPLDTNVVASVVERCAALALSCPEIAELDMNPVMVGLDQNGKTTAIAADVKFRIQ